MQQFALLWIVLETTGSLTQLSVVVLLQGLPMLSLILVGGVMADRLNRRRVLLATQSGPMAVAVALAVLLTAGWLAMWHIYLGALTLGSFQAFNQPARRAMTRDLVPHAAMMSAVTLESLLMTSTRVIGPAMSGAIIGALGLAASLYAIAGFYLVGVLFLWATPYMAVVRRPFERRPSVVGDLLGGVRYAAREPALRSIILLAFGVGFFGMAYLQLNAAVAREVWNLPADAAGRFVTAAGVGALLGSVALVALSHSRRKNWLLIVVGMGFPVALGAYALSPWLWLAVVSLGLLGLTSTATTSMINTLIQYTAPGEYLGRMFSLTQIGASLMYVDAAPIGALGEAIGLRWSMAAALLFLVHGAVILLYQPHLRRLRAD